MSAQFKARVLRKSEDEPENLICFGEVELKSKTLDGAKAEAHGAVGRQLYARLRNNHVIQIWRYYPNGNCEQLAETTVGKQFR